MNRQIYGFTLFVFIVKSAFLIYWVFLAPVSLVRILNVESQLNQTAETIVARSAVKSDNEYSSCVAIEQAVLDLDSRMLHVKLRFESHKNELENNDNSVADSLSGVGFGKKLERVSLSLLAKGQTEDVVMTKDLAVPTASENQNTTDLTISDVKLDNFASRQQNLLLEVRGCNLAAVAEKEVLIIAPRK